MNVTGPLEGLCILDITTGVAGPFATKLMADFGARVIKVEPPGGDPSRRDGPFPGDIEN
ncbi:MAG: CoA transferase, partial [Dehalococcoidia bacterium]|nr:CoA transferase [Dehalococcoidia bacterium]